MSLVLDETSIRGGQNVIKMGNFWTYRLNYWETVENRWVHAAMRLTSIGSSFYPCVRYDAAWSNLHTEANPACWLHSTNVWYILQMSDRDFTCWRGAEMVRVSDLQSRVRGFDCRLCYFQVATLGKLFTHMCPCHQEHNIVLAIGRWYSVAWKVVSGWWKVILGFMSFTGFMTKARFPLPELTARVDRWPVLDFHYPSTRPVLTGNGNPKPVTRQLGPSTRVVETGL